ncbi:single-stranded DNA-binding protein [candidate division WWE3 bacterium]|uniref:Single-stranded DNA-binding protein n=1 Tax=candidate division WWE3 bacterium TaxID=2053526 RepID=A0A955LJK3_UNCKA|nr:single-stranded DNA-binding protein [candidate division WWE3 bacterium]
MAVRSLNKVMLIGNLTRDPELRYTSSGTAVATFGVATNREYSPSNTESTVEDTEFHNIVAWAKLGELCEKLLHKGDKVYIEGRLQTRDWNDEASGKKMYRTEIVAGEMILLNSRRSGDGGQEDASYDQGSQGFGTGGSQQGSGETSTQSDEIPF